MLMNSHEQVNMCTYVRHRMHTCAMFFSLQQWLLPPILCIIIIDSVFLYIDMYIYIYCCCYDCVVIIIVVTIV